MSVLVTGAAGTVGNQIVKALTKKAFRVLAIDLPGSKILEHEKVSVIKIDLSTAEQPLINALVQKCHIVINAAAIVDISRPKTELWPANVEIPKKLARAVEDQPYCRIVHISSGSVYDSSRRAISESHPMNLQNAYEESKAESEKVIIQNCKDWTILRPGLIYGPRARFLGATLAALPPLFSLIGKSTIGFTGGPRASWVHAEDVARAAIHCATSTETYESVYNVASNAPLFGDTISDYIKAYGLNIISKVDITKPSKLKRFKFLINRNINLKIINFYLNSLWKVVSYKENLDNSLSVKVDKEMLPYLFQDTVFDSSELKKTSFHYKHEKDIESILSVLRWYEKNSWIPRLGY
jgi:nucleoside-diphosphate-sugar epimerase